MDGPTLPSATLPDLDSRLTLLAVLEYHVLASQ